MYIVFERISSNLALLYIKIIDISVGTNCAPFVAEVRRNLIMLFW